MSDFLIQTLIWTGALIALVLVLRRPVARQFGPGAAYALWALPALRLIMPPLVLPAWLAPAAEPSALVADPGPMLAAPDVMAFDAAPLPVTPLYEPAVEFDLSTALIALWLIGAAILLVRRFALYHRMRRDLLEYARAVGETGGVRLVETDAVEGPLAFGVIDRVVALPSGFMTARDRRTRDLAIAHELAHHRGRDLLANMLVQPLFALHWFNPLGWMGWIAMRRDQEAACDARVVARSDAEERATYAAVIAGFATGAGGGARPALAAPMACPVLGDKSIIHRLRSLTMAEISPRRRFASRALLVGGALALPLTASISYAETIDLPEAPAAPPAPAAPAEVPAVPLPPAPPEPPELDEQVQGELADMERELAAIEGKTAEVKREFVRDGAQHVLRVRRTGVPGEIQHEVERRSETRTERTGDASDITIRKRDREAADADLARMFADVGKVEFDPDKLRAQVDRALATAPRVVMSCRKGQRDIVTTMRDADGRETMLVCQDKAFSMARFSVESARRAIASDKSLPEEARVEALRSMDEALAELDASREEASGA